MRKIVGKAVLTFGLVASAFNVSAAGDDRPIKVIVGYAAGGATDVVARYLAKGIAEDLGRPVVVENKPGGAALIANRALAKAPPDGLTYMIGPMTATIFREVMYDAEKRGYSMLTDYAPVATLTTYPLGLAISKSLKVDSVKDFVEWIKKNPKDASFGASAMGSHTHLIGVEFARQVGAPMQVVPYPSNGASAVALMGHQIPAAVITSAEISSAQDRFHVLGIFTESRSPLLPGVKTMKEQGVDVVGGEAWMGMWAPAKAPQADVKSMADALRRVLGNKEVQSFLEKKFGMSAMYKSPAEMDLYQRKELEFWRGIIKESGFTPAS